MSKTLIDIKLLTDDPKFLPEYKTKGSAGVDLRANIASETTILPGQRTKIGSGIAVHIKNPGLVGMVVPRSGLGSKGLVLANTVGIIDSDYTGEIILACANTGDDPIVIQPGDRIAQLLFVGVFQVIFRVCNDLNETDRGANGFGSTGKN